MSEESELHIPIQQDPLKKAAEPEFEPEPELQLEPEPELKQDDEQVQVSQPTAAKVPERGKWGRQIEFLMAMISCAIGLGNVWRFPYLVYKNGGGAFLIPYVIMVFIVGLPLFFLETSLGQFTNRSVITVWNVSPLFKGMGYAGIFLIVLVAVYYNVLVAQFIYYFVLSMSDPLPWKGCCDWWGPSPCCRECLPNDTDCTPTCNNSVASDTCTEYVLPAEDFYNRYVVQISSSIEDFGSPVWQIVVALIVNWILVTAGIVFGARSYGKVAYFTAIFPYAMLIAMLIRGVTLEGSLDGILYYIVPDLERLLDVTVWMDAAGQVFFSIGAANFMLVVLASYNDFKHPLLRDACIVIVLDMFTSILSGFVVFSVLGYMAFEKNVAIPDVVTSGPSLVFETYPTALATMPLAPLWSVLFFLMMMTLGVGSSFSYIESLLLSFQDLMKPSMKDTGWKRVSFRVLVCFAMFLLGLPLTCNGGMYLLSLIDTATGTFGLLILGCSECIVLTWVYGWRRLFEDLRFMTGKYPNYYFLASWTVITPLTLLVVLIMNAILFEEPTYNGYLYPDWAIVIAFFIMLSPLIFIPMGALIHLFYDTKVWIIVRESLRPMADWGPSDAAVRDDYLKSIPEKFRTFQTQSQIAETYSQAMEENQEAASHSIALNKVAPMTA